MTIDIETKIRLIALKKAAIVMDALANTLTDEAVRNETKSLASTITWAANYIEEKS